MKLIVVVLYCLSGSY